MISLINESPIIFSVLATTVIIAASFNYRIVVASIILLICALIWFYRHPICDISHLKGITSPAYGIIKKIEVRHGIIHIIIYLSIFDVHVQYAPCDGKVIDRIYDHTGKYNLAYDLNKSKFNEKVITVISSNDQNIKVTQIAGFLVRRISNILRIDDKINIGQKIGMIKFGSRVDIEIPASGFNIMVAEGDYVRGPNTQLGIMSSSKEHMNNV